MVNCTLDADCPFLYYCTQKLECEHKPIFPLELYPILIYILLPFGAGFVNIAGKSMGILKIAILNNLLRYDASQSTALTQPMVAGAALPNVISAIFKRHPYRDTTLIDYDIILVVIPCSLLGSTMGSFIEKLLPSVVKDIAIIVFFFSFAVSFFRKFRSIKLQQKESQQNQKTILLKKQQKLSLQTNQALQNQPQHIKWKKLIIINYQKTLHVRDIILSLIMFLVFQVLVFLVQGKFPFYTFEVCTWQYMSGLAALVVVVLVYQQIVRRYFKRKYQEYRQLGIKRNFDLSATKNFGLICFGGYFAGLAQGILGVGSGTFIMGVFMAINLDPRVAAATSCYQILFIGMAAFIEQFIRNNILLQDAGFLFLLTGVGGGIFTMFLYWLLKRFDDKKISRILVMTMFVLCSISSLFMIPFAVQSYLQFGIDYLTKIKFHC